MYTRKEVLIYGNMEQNWVFAAVTDFDFFLREI